MSTTTGRDLMTRADLLARQLTRCNLPVDTGLWEAFDTTAYAAAAGLIGALIGRAPSG